MTEFEIHTSDNTSIVADFATNAPSELNTIERGSQATYTFGNVKSKLVIKSGDTYTVPADTTEQWDIVVVKGTLDVNGRIKIDSLEIDGGTVDIDTTPYDVGGLTVNADETVYFSPAIVPSGETLTVYGTFETQALTVNGTVTGDGDVNIQDFDRPPTNGVVDVNEKYAIGLDDAQAYGPYTGDYTISETQLSTQKYHERITPDANIDTLLVGVEPDTDLQQKNIRGYWGLIDNITDNRTQALSNVRVTLSIDVLAPYDEYSDHTAVQNELEI